MRLGEAECLAKRLIAEYNPNVTFAWSRTKNSFGDYYWKSKRIRLSSVLVPQMTEEEVSNTVKHEIAHSLSPAGHGHGPIWQSFMVNMFGLPPNRCSDIEVDLTKIKGTWRSVCPNGHRSDIVFMRKPSKIRSCGKCSPVFDNRYLLTYIKG